MQPLDQFVGLAALGRGLLPASLLAGPAGSALTQVTLTTQDFLTPGKALWS